MAPIKTGPRLLPNHSRYAGRDTAPTCCCRFGAPYIMARSAPALDSDSSQPMIHTHQGRSQPDPQLFDGPTHDRNDSTGSAGEPQIPRLLRSIESPKVPRSGTPTRWVERTIAAEAGTAAGSASTATWLRVGPYAVRRHEAVPEWMRLALGAMWPIDSCSAPRARRTQPATSSGSADDIDPGPAPFGQFGGLVKLGPGCC